MLTLSGGVYKVTEAYRIGCNGIPDVMYGEERDKWAKSQRTAYYSPSFVLSLLARSAPGLIRLSLLV